eukprot:CAMPEP_0183513554 /NCGR_PEP_ID=MMETSP0371-20130417/12285_1 /TAXON_ID=268820 /ORGANISM="Peridinium aciculiferum, Strain PAER-2" /LENGTH=143 /DNA_ID=CAMNT_0025710811 /DNA_START=652 /DNA_END=1083 /DNA_ORIENTATION=+
MAEGTWDNDRAGRRLQVDNEQQEYFLGLRQRPSQLVAQPHGRVDLFGGVADAHEEPRRLRGHAAAAVEAIHPSSHVRSCERNLQVVVPKAATPPRAAEDDIGTLHVVGRVRKEILEFNIQAVHHTLDGRPDPIERVGVALHAQ